MRAKSVYANTIGEAVRHNVFLGIRQSDYPEIPPAFWNLLCSLTTGIFRSLTGVARQLRVEAPGHEQERILFRELPKLLTKVVLDVATWWWSYDRGFMGSTLRCPICGAVLKFRGDTNKGMGTPFGMICPRRSYYQCANKNCRTSICPLDQRLGLDGDSFLPCLQEIVVWLTSLDSYGKSLQCVGKLLNFSISHRSAWKLTQKIGEVVKKRLEKQVAQAFADPRNVVLPKAEVAPPDVGVVMFNPILTGKFRTRRPGSGYRMACRYESPLWRRCISGSELYPTSDSLPSRLLPQRPRSELADFGRTISVLLVAAPGLIYRHWGSYLHVE